MRRRPFLSLIRLFMILALVAGSSLILLPAAQAQCPDGYHHVPTDSIPQGIDGNGNGSYDDGVTNGDFHAFGGEPTCVQMVRTLVFVGTTEIDNGINFNGVGAPTGGPAPYKSMPSPFTDVAEDFADYSTAGPSGGGHYWYTGFCIMVDWEHQDGAAGPNVVGTASCDFQDTPGIYGPQNSNFPLYGPDAEDGSGVTRNPNQGDFDRGVWAWQTSDGSDPQTCQGNGLSSTGGTCSPAAHNPLGFAPPGQTGCIGGTDGFGVSQFTARTTNDEGSGTVDTIYSKYYWDNGLTNFKGYITDSLSQPKKWVFDAKIRVDPDPAGLSKTSLNDPLEGAAAGCLEKLGAQNGVNVGSHIAGRTGLNFLLVVGTASWNLEVVKEYLPVV